MKGIDFELLIQNSPRDFDAQIDGVLPLDSILPSHASPEPFRLHGHDFIDFVGSQALKERFLVDIVFLGDGYLKFYLPAFLLVTNSMPNPPGQASAFGNSSMVEFVGIKNLPRHLRPK